MAIGAKDSARPHNNQLGSVRTTTAREMKRMRAARVTVMAATVTMSTRGTTMVTIMANSNKDSTSPHSTTINLR